MATVRVGDVEQRWNRNGQAAVASVRLGWRVLPWRLIEGRKVPQIRQWQSGQAFSTEDDVRAWWGVNFTHSPGIVCGPQSRLWVLDVDPRNGGDATLRALVATYGELPADTFLVTTPGGGWHYYFEWTAECEGLRKHQMHGHAGLDVMADGGWVAAPGGWSDAGRYDLVAGGNAVRPAPGWLLSLAMAGNPSAAEEGLDHSETDGTGGADAWLEAEIARVGATPQGYQRQTLLSFTAQLRRRGYVRAVAEWAALEAMGLLAADPDKGPWSEVDVLAMVAGAWSKYAPVDLSWDLARYNPQPGEGRPLADQPAPPAPPPGPVEYPPPATPPAAPVAAEDAPAPPAELPPPAGAVVLGEPPEAIGPDHENAQALAAFARGRLMMVNDRWLHWDGQVWAADDALLRRHAVVVELGHTVVQAAAAAGPDGYTELIRRANRLGTVQGRDACLNYAKHLMSVDVSELDTAVDWINTPDGMVNLETGERRPARPGDLVTRVTAAGYDPAVSDPLWEHVLAQVIPDPDDRAFFQRWCGYCLTGRTSEKVILAIHGPAGSGKSTVSEPLAKAMGQYAQVWQPDVIVDRAAVNVDEAMYRVRGARLVTVSEMRRGTRLNEGVIKAATGGDTVAARGLYMAGIEYRPQFKLWVHTNFVPDSADDALMRRFAFLRMQRELSRGEQDPRVKVWLEESPEAQRAILAWAVRGWQMALAAGGVGRPPRSDAEVAEHLLRSDPVRRFVEEVLVSGEGWLESSAMYVAYETWCHAERIAKPLGPNKFTAAMDERGVRRERFSLQDGTRVTGYRGWTLSDGVRLNDYGV